MAAGLESSAVFEARALQIGMSSNQLKPLVDAGISSMGDLAFCCSYQPGSGPDESPLVDFYKKIYGDDIEVSLMVKLRRLFFEAHTLSVVEMKNRVERTEDEPVRRMAVPERAARHKAQQSKLVGLDLSGEYECSFQLIDRVQHQYDSNELKYIPPSECTKREQEVLGQKTDEKLKLDLRSGDLKISKQAEESSADLGTDLRLKNAFIRRCLAYDQCGLISFDHQEKWVAMIFKRLAEPPEKGYAQVTMEQVLRADQKLFVGMAEDTRSAIVPKPGERPPLDQAIKERMNSAEVQLLLLPRPAASKEARSYPYEGQGKKGGPKGKGKGKDKGSGKGKGPKAGGKLKPPQGCCSATADGRYICFAFNGQGCHESSVQPGDRCTKGYHICGKRGCFGNHSMQNCTKS